MSVRRIAGNYFSLDSTDYVTGNHLRNGMTFGFLEFQIFPEIFLKKSAENFPGKSGRKFSGESPAGNISGNILREISQQNPLSPVGIPRCLRLGD